MHRRFPHAHTVHKVFLLYFPFFQSIRIESVPRSLSGKLQVLVVDGLPVIMLFGQHRGVDSYLWVFNG